MFRNMILLWQGKSWAQVSGLNGLMWKMRKRSVICSQSSYFLGQKGWSSWFYYAHQIGKSTTSCESSSICIFWSRNLFTTLETSTNELHRGIGCKDSLRKLALKPSPTVIWVLIMLWMMDWVDAGNSSVKCILWASVGASFVRHAGNARC
jgi:hypothetical protein